MSSVPPPARDIGLTARDVVDRVTLEARGLPRRIAGKLLEHLEAVDAALAALSKSPLDDVDHLSRYDLAIAGLQKAQKHITAAPAAEPSDEDAARALLEAAGAKLPPKSEPLARPSAERLAATLTSVESSIASAKQRAIDLIVASQNEILRAIPKPRDATSLPPFRASVGLPSTHAVQTKIAVDLPREEEDEDADLELYDSVTPSSRSPEEEELRRLARECIVDIGVLGHLRFTPPEMRWSVAVARFDQRLLDNLDALLAFARSVPGGAPGDPSQSVIDELWLYTGDAPVPDPSRAFACSFVLASIDGEDAARAAVLSLRAADASTLSAHRHALTIAPSTHVKGALRQLLGSGTPEQIELALDVLRLRQEPEYGRVALLLGHPDPIVREAAARCLAVAAPRASVVVALSQALTAEDDDVVKVALARSLTLCDDPAGLACARLVLEEELLEPGGVAPEARLGYLRLLGVAGAASDAEILLRSLGHEPDEASALGWFGHPEHIDPLLAALEKAEKQGPNYHAYCVALGAAVHRIIGGPVPSSDDPDEEVASGRPGRFLPAGTLRAFWQTKQAKVAKGARLRFGVPYTPLSTLDELERDSVLIEDRAELAFEIALWSDEPPIFEQHWIARQRAEIARLRDRVSAPAQSGAGDWLGQRRRSP